MQLITKKIGSKPKHRVTSKLLVRLIGLLVPIMKENNKNNSSLVPVNSKRLTHLEKSIGITEKILKEQNDRLFVLSWDILFEHKDFFNQFFSTYYSFSESQLIAFQGKLSVGSPYIDLLDDLSLNRKTEFGLIFNKNIIWTEELKKIYYEEPRLLWVGHQDVYSFEIKFDDLPLDINKEIERVKYIYQNQIIDDCQYDYYNIGDKLDNLDSNFNILLLRKNFSNEDILKVVINYSTNYYFSNIILGNIVFCKRLISKIHKDINDFNIESFYLNTNT